jgi:23S rRNA pseudouridine1911/1915/1917 synthase
MNNRKKILTGNASEKSKQTVIQITEPSSLMQFLQLHFKDKSRTTIKSLLTHRQVSVDHKIVTQHDHALHPGQIIIVNWGKTAEEIHYPDMRILFEDEYLIVIEKEAGLLSIATDKEIEKTAYSMLSFHVKKADPRNKIFVVHRLDRETSGVMLFAKSQEIQFLLQEEWKNTILERTYLAVVEGVFEKNHGTITSWLRESKALIVYSSQDPDKGQKSVTHYRVLKQNNSYAMLEINLETGRKNQIRVHMQDIGHSIVGDKKYGAKSSPIGRLGLHAQVLSFRHPKTNKIVKFETQIPPKFSRLFFKN